MIGYVNGTLTVGGIIGVNGESWNNPAAITYGAAISSSQLNATARRAGTFAYTPTNNSVPNSGVNTLAVVKRRRTRRITAAIRLTATVKT